MKGKIHAAVCMTFVMSLFLFTVAGCGGGGGGGVTSAPATTLSGTVAAGAVVVGTVTIKDSSVPTPKQKTVTIAADGKYTVDVSDMIAPFAMRADGFVGGTQVHLYSAATAADVGGTINITPFTDLIIANIAGDIAANYFNNGSYATLSKAELDAANAALTAKLLPVLRSVGLSDSIDLLRTAFSADQTGLDGVLDVLKVTVDPTTKTAEIMNIITNTKIADDLKSKSDASGFTSNDATGVAAGLIDLQAVVKGFDNLSALFATSLPAANNAQLLAFFDEATFMEDGQNLAAFLGGITSNPSMIGAKFTDVSLVALDPVAGTAEVAFEMIILGERRAAFYSRSKMIRKNNVWLLQGNQRIAYANISAVSTYSPQNTSAPIKTGLYMSIHDDGGKGVRKAIVKGPGLPVAGVTLIYIASHRAFGIEGQTDGDPLYVMNDAAIDTIPDTSTSYAVELLDAFNSVMATYTGTLRKRPYKLAELSSASFPGIASPTVADWKVFTGGSLTVTWTLPAGLSADFIYARLDGAGQSVDVDKGPLAPAATTATITIQPQTPSGTTFTITNRYLEVGVADGFGRVLITDIF